MAVSKPVCTGLCKKFRVSKPIGSRYGAGQALCQTCATWIDYRGAHKKGGYGIPIRPATKGSTGWYCNCCNYRVRQNPRNKVYKEKLRDHMESLKTSKDQEPLDEFLKTDKLNHLIERALRLIKSSKKGAYVNDLRMLLEISQEEISSLTTKLIRIDNISKKEIMHDGKFWDILLLYEESKPTDVVNSPIDDPQETYENPQHDKPVISKNDEQYMGSKKTQIEEDQSISDDILKLTQQMVDEYTINKKQIDKNLRIRLTKEFIESRSMDKVISDNHELSKETVKRHVRTSLRLPKKLKELENEGALHSDPNYSLHMALYAVNYYDWDGEEKDESKVTDLAISISKASHKTTLGLKPPKTISSGTFTKNAVTAVTAIWIATATLHKEHGIHSVFSNKTIIKKTMEQNLHNTGYSTISAHVGNHCVANAKLGSSSPHRYLYREGLGRYRLYHKNDPYNRDRRYGGMSPRIQDLPDEYKDLIEWYESSYNITSDVKPESDNHTQQNEDSTTAVAVWVAVATLHKRFGVHRDFSYRDIMTEIIAQNLCHSKEATIRSYISTHCVANNKVITHKYRKLYRVSAARYRLYRRGDYHNPDRKNGQIEPDKDQIPIEHRNLIQWYQDTYCDDNPIESQPSPTTNWTTGMSLKKGQLFTEEQLQDRFKVANSGGIRPSSKDRTIILISHATDTKGYETTIKQDPEFLTYIGSGQDDQTMTRTNKSILASKQNGYVVLYFERHKFNRFEFKFQVEYDSHSFSKQKNLEGLLRRVILFKLRIL